MYSMGGLNKSRAVFSSKRLNFQYMTVVCCGETSLWFPVRVSKLYSRSFIVVTLESAE